MDSYGPAGGYRGSAATSSRSVPSSSQYTQFNESPSSNRQGQSQTVCFWPRHEAFHLVLTALAQNGKTMSNGLLYDIARNLNRVQSTDGQISFDKWLITAKEYLKWNDWCIRLFWDMLQQAIFSRYQDETMVSEEFVNIGELVIFLIMHQLNGPGSRAASPTKTYDTYWPAAEDVSSAVPGSPTSPIKRAGGGSSSRPSSPKARIPHIHVKQSKSSSQHASVLKERIPFMLKVLSAIENGFTDAENTGITYTRSTSVDECDASTSSNGSSNASFAFANQEVVLSRRSLEALGLALCGGFSKEEDGQDLIPVFLQFAHATESSRLGVVDFNSEDSDSGHLASSPPRFASRAAGTGGHGSSWSFLAPELVEWIESNINVNDVRYPHIPSPSVLSPGRQSQHLHRNREEEGGEWTATTSQQSEAGRSPTKQRAFFPSLDTDVSLGGDTEHPISEVVSISSPLFKSPIIVYKRQNITMQLVSYKQDSATTGNKGAGNEGAFGLGGLSLGSKPEGKRLVVPDEDITRMSLQDEWRTVRGRERRRAQELPPLYIQGCFGTCLYYLGPYSNVSITNCNDCHVVLGAVSGVVRMVGCERIRLTVVTRKVLIVSCLDCVLNLSCLLPTILAGENKGIIVGPYNSNYRLLKSHILTAGLRDLLRDVGADSAMGEFSRNQWSIIHDVASLLESPLALNSPTGYAIDAAESHNRPPPPMPAESVVRLMKLEEFLFASVPIQSEQRSFEMGFPLDIPPVYTKALESRQARFASLQQSVIDVLNNPGNINPPGSSVAATSEVAACGIMSRKFLEWVLRSGRAQHVIDLIRIDRESVSYGNVRNEVTDTANSAVGASELAAASKAVGDGAWIREGGEKQSRGDMKV